MHIVSRLLLLTRLIPTIMQRVPIDGGACKVHRLLSLKHHCASRGARKNTNSPLVSEAPLCIKGSFRLTQKATRALNPKGCCCCYSPKSPSHSNQMCSNPFALQALPLLLPPQRPVYGKKQPELCVVLLWCVLLCFVMFCFDC